MSAHAFLTRDRQTADKNFAAVKATFKHPNFLTDFVQIVEDAMTGTKNNRDLKKAKTAFKACLFDIVVLDSKFDEKDKKALEQRTKALEQATTFFGQMLDVHYCNLNELPPNRMSDVRLADCQWNMLTTEQNAADALLMLRKSYRAGIHVTFAERYDSENNKFLTERQDEVLDQIVMPMQEIATQTLRNIAARIMHPDEQEVLAAANFKCIEPQQYDAAFNGSKLHPRPSFCDN